MMKALRYTKIGEAPEVMEIPVPEPGPGELLLKITAAGVCHSDDFVMGLSEQEYQDRKFPLPLTLGHEGAGIVHQLGEGTGSTFAVGDAVAVYGPWGCGRCLNCSKGLENYCTNAAAEGIRPPGLGNHGAMAEYMIVDDPRHLIALGDLDPVENVSLTDAGLTPYHAIKTSLPKMGAGTFAVVIGVGGLGHIAIQILRALSAATTIIALDVDDAKLKLAERLGAHHTLISDEGAAEAIHDITDGAGASAIFDFVGANPTMALAKQVAAANSDITLVGVGGGSLEVSFGGIAYDAAVRVPYWGSRDEFIEVFELARAGKIRVEVETYTLDDAPQAYVDLAANKLSGRAVIIP